MIAAHQTMLAPQSAPLPYDAEVEYIEGTGDQFLDTGYKTCESSHMVFDAMYNGYATSGYSSTMLFGSQTSVGGAAATALAVWLNSNGQMSFNDIGFDSGWVSSPTIASGSRHVFAIENRTLFLDGTSIRSSGATGAYRSTVSVCLLRANTPTGYQSGSNRRMKGRIYSFSASESGILAFDGIPVRVGSGSSAVGYLFDRVSGELFGNAGTGAFTIGPDK